MLVWGINLIITLSWMLLLISPHDILHYISWIYFPIWHPRIFGKKSWSIALARCYIRTRLVKKAIYLNLIFIFRYYKTALLSDFLQNKKVTAGVKTSGNENTGKRDISPEATIQLDPFAEYFICRVTGSESISDKSTEMEESYSPWS